jgi:RNA polymerase sigma factor (sigma-70 family)
MDVDQLWQAYWDQGEPVELRNELVERHFVFVEQSAKYWVNRLKPQIELDELRGLAGFWLIYAVENWDPARGASFKTYARDCINTHYFLEAKREGRRRSRFFPISQSEMDSPVYDAPIEDPPPDLAGIIKASDLDVREREIIRLRYHGGLLLREIAERYGLTKERIRQIIEESLQKIRPVALDFVAGRIT